MYIDAFSMSFGAQFPSVNETNKYIDTYSVVYSSIGLVIGTMCPGCLFPETLVPRPSLELVCKQLVFFRGVGKEVYMYCTYKSCNILFV
jgi:hypothetical protein